jgi:molybdate transport repressor ModE-like protein
MTQVSIRPQWTLRQTDGQALPARLLELLTQVHAVGSLSAACAAQGLSYRHAWELVRQGEAFFGTALLRMERGKGSTLTPLGEKLVWADQRIAARLGPALDTLASELALEIAQVLSSGQAVLRMHASHGFAVERLVELLGREPGLTVDRKYGSSTEAVAALADGVCDVAGLHLPEGPPQAALLAHYQRWLDPVHHRVIDLAVRRQGLMVASGNPRKVYGVADLARPGLRFINRQSGSGSRLLLEVLLREADLAPESIAGYERGEYTHAAVAAFVASDMADVGFGLEPPARQFKLDFIPLARERYFLLCHEHTLATPPMQALLAVLATPAYRAAVDALPGYQAEHTGRVTPLAQAFPGGAL